MTDAIGSIVDQNDGFTYLPLNDILDKKYRELAEKLSKITSIEESYDLYDEFEGYAYLTATSFLLRGMYGEYDQYISNFNKLKIPGRPSAFYGSISPLIRTTRDIENYLSIFSGNKFRSQNTLMKYIKFLLDVNCENGQIESYTEEKSTWHGRCDLFIEQIGSRFLLELKIDAIKRKDIYQVFDYHLGTIEKYPGVILGSSISEDNRELADRLGISVYIYNIHQYAPTCVSFSHVSGEKFNIIEELGGVFLFLSDIYDRFARHMNWPLARYQREFNPVMEIPPKYCRPHLLTGGQGAITGYLS